MKLTSEIGHGGLEEEKLEHANALECDDCGFEEEVSGEEKSNED